jgi:hypothetical protein
MMPARLTRPNVGLSPTQPQRAAGMRMLPPVSVPRVPSASRAAMAAPEPPLEPPGMRSGSHGLRAGVGVIGGGAPGEFVGVRLPEQDRARLAEHGGHGRIAFRDTAAENGRAGGRFDACGVVQVLESDGDAVERAAVDAGPELFLCVRSVGKGPLGRHQDEGVQPGIEPRNPVEAGAGELGGGEFAALDGAGGLGDGQAGWVGHRREPAIGEWGLQVRPQGSRGGRATGGRRRARPSRWRRIRRRRERRHPGRPGPVLRQ